ncbi:MAG: hypothetical protein AAFN92_15750, partial [Bacteroidota bacterium]
RRWVAVKILIGRGAFRTGMDIAKKLYQVTRQYEFTEISLDICRMMSSQYGYRFGDREQFERYNRDYDQMIACFHAEAILERHFSNLAMAHLHNQEKDIFLEMGDSLEREITPYLEKFDSYRVHLCGRSALIWCAINTYDYRKTIDYCTSGIAFFLKKPYVANTPLGMFLHYKMLCHNQLREYEDGRQTAEMAKQHYVPGTQNYFKFQESLILLEIHTKHYQEAYLTYQRITGLKEFKKLRPRSIEIWHLYGAYLEYLLIIGVFQRPPGADENKKFRLNRFLNEVPIFNKEKRRRNIPVLVLQILFLIHRDRYAAAADRIEAVEKYCSRYLKKDSSFRSNCFIKMLLQIPQTAFHVAAVKRKAERFHQRLLDNPMEMTSQSWEVEVIPYEELWEYALGSLGHQRIIIR